LGVGLGKFDHDMTGPGAIRRGVRAPARVVRIEPSCDILSDADVVLRRRFRVLHNVDEAPSAILRFYGREAWEAHAIRDLRANGAVEGSIRESENDGPPSPLRGSGATAFGLARRTVAHATVVDSRERRLVDHMCASSNRPIRWFREVDRLRRTA
jgi:hypothetical protein